MRIWLIFITVIVLLGLILFFSVEALTDHRPDAYRAVFIAYPFFGIWILAALRWFPARCAECGQWDWDCCLNPLHSEIPSENLKIHIGSCSFH